MWTYDFQDVDSLGLPSVFNGAVYIANGKGISQVQYPYLWSLDAQTGTVNWAAALSAQWEQYWAPLRVGNVVYTNAGTFGGLYGISSTDGSQTFFVSLDQYDSWSPAYFSEHLYTFMAGSFRQHNPLTGAVLSTVKVNWSGYSMNTAPVFGTELAYVIAPPSLIAIDPASQSVAWSASGSYAGTPAVWHNLVFGISAGNLIVRDATTGVLAWTFVGDTQLKYPPVFANGYLYVASDAHLYAVNLLTHQQVYQDTIGGWLSISNRRLIVAATNGTLTAYLMSQ